MTNAQKSSVPAENAAPALRQPGRFLENAAGTECNIEVEAIAKVSAQKPIKSVAGILQASSKKGSSGSCRQILWFSFFFDGTGNNLTADVETSKHSNVARLYGAHRGNENNGGVEGRKKGEDFGIYRFYVPGIGTLFEAIGDDGGSSAGLGAGAYGTERLEWALNEFNRQLKKHVGLAKNPANQILEVNIAAFGFSRGAALARAFIHNFVKKQCSSSDGKKWRLDSCDARVRVRFLGLFDTVASVGLAMSANNMEKYDALKGDVKTHISNRLSIHRETRPEILAFSRDGGAGADPAPGNYDGHSDWGGLMQIPKMVEDVRHFIAGHELRNSFPVDSITVLGSDGKPSKPMHFHEYVYPGVHSDVGGSYRPGEGGRSEKSTGKFGLLPLHSMYEFATVAGVPFLSKSAFDEESQDDFRVHPSVLVDFNYYMSQLDTESKKSLGHAFNAHMKLYYEWRFRSIRMKRLGDRIEANRILKSEAQFSKEGVQLQKKIDELEGKYSGAVARKKIAEWALDDYIQQASGDSRDGAKSAKLHEAVRVEEVAIAATRARLLPLKAKMLSLPKTSELPEIIRIYDNQLMADAQIIYDFYSRSKGSTGKQNAAFKWENLRPHYKVLMEAYEREFIDDSGLKDERLIHFFDEYIHDSLAGFGKDATLPSDPRVIYVGDDNKLKYAVHHVEDTVFQPA